MQAKLRGPSKIFAFSFQDSEQPPSIEDTQIEFKEFCRTLQDQIWVPGLQGRKEKLNRVL